MDFFFFLYHRELKVCFLIEVFVLKKNNTCIKFGMFKKKKKKWCTSVACKTNFSIHVIKAEVVLKHRVWVLLNRLQI